MAFDPILTNTVRDAWAGRPTDETAGLSLREVAAAARPSVRDIPCRTPAGRAYVSPLYPAVAFVGVPVSGGRTAFIGLAANPYYPDLPVFAWDDTPSGLSDPELTNWCAEQTAEAYAAAAAGRCNPLQLSARTAALTVIRRAANQRIADENRKAAATRRRDYTRPEVIELLDSVPAETPEARAYRDRVVAILLGHTTKDSVST